MTQLKRWERDFQLERLSRLHLFDEYIEMSKYNKHKDSKKIRTLINFYILFTFTQINKYYLSKSFSMDLLQCLLLRFLWHRCWLC